MENILVVIDMQNDFVSGCLGSTEAQNIVGRIVKKIEHYDGSIFYTMDTHFEDYLKTQEGKRLPVMHCVKYTPGWELCKEVKAEIEKKGRLDYGFEKHTFASIALAEQIQKTGAKEIELIGVCTDICVIANAMLLKAYLPEAIIKVDASCCAGVTKESHKTALCAMQMCQIEVTE